MQGEVDLIPSSSSAANALLYNLWQLVVNQLEALNCRKSGAPAICPRLNTALPPFFPYKNIGAGPCATIEAGG